jgi:hypothetical protein
LLIALRQEFFQLAQSDLVMTARRRSPRANFSGGNPLSHLRVRAGNGNATLAQTQQGIAVENAFGFKLRGDDTGEWGAWAARRFDGCGCDWFGHKMVCGKKATTVVLLPQ